MIRSTLPPRRRKLLVVDDDYAVGDAIAQALGDRYDVTVARDGVEGAECAIRQRPDLVVSDVTMPRLDGLGMIRRIRQELGVKIPVIFLTALDTPRDVIAGIGAGALHYLAKPVDLNDLERRIAKALRV